MTPTPTANAAPCENPDATAPINTPESARDLVLRLADTMDKLLELVEVETAIVRAGRLSQLPDIENGKSVLARRYIRDMDCFKANAPFIGRAIPELIAEFRDGYVQFRAAIELNLKTLATAQAVSEGIVRGVAADMASQERPQTYRADGRSGAGKPQDSRPIAVSRTL